MTTYDYQPNYQARQDTVTRPVTEIERNHEQAGFFVIIS